MKAGETTFTPAQNNADRQDNSLGEGWVSAPDPPGKPATSSVVDRVIPPEWPQTNTAPIFTATHFFQDTLALLAFIGMIVKYHKIFVLTVDGNIHLPLTVATHGGSCALALALSLLAKHLSQRQADLQKEADYLHRVIRVSLDLRLSLPEVESLHQKYCHSKDSLRWIREMVIAAAAWRQAAAQSWKVYGVGMEVCTPMLISTSAFLALLPLRWLCLSRATTSPEYHFINILTIAVRACLSMMFHYDAREACVGQLVTDPRLVVTMAKSAVPVALACALHPVGLRNLKFVLPGFILLYQLPFAYLTLHSPANEGSAGWILALDMTERFKVMLLLYILPSALAATLVYAWHHHCACQQLSKFLQRKTRRIFDVLLANRRI